MSALLIQQQQSNYHHNNCDFIIDSGTMIMPLSAGEIDPPQTNNQTLTPVDSTSGTNQNTNNMEQQYSQYSVFNSPPASNEMILEQSNFTLNQAHHQLNEQQQMRNGNIQNDDNQQLAELFKCTLGDNDFADPFQQIEEYPLDLDGWNQKPPDQWNSMEVVDWIRAWARRNDVQEIEIAHLLYSQMNGLEFCSAGPDYLCSVCPQYGTLMYHDLQTLLSQYRTNSNSQAASSSLELYQQPSNQTQQYQASQPPQQTQTNHGQDAVTTNSIQNNTQIINNNQNMTIVIHNTCHASAHPNGNTLHEMHHAQPPPPPSTTHHHLQNSHPSHYSSMQQFDFFGLDCLAPPTAGLMFESPIHGHVNYSPGYTTESDRESTSSNLSGVNERRMTYPVHMHHSQPTNGHYGFQHHMQQQVSPLTSSLCSEGISSPSPPMSLENVSSKITSSNSKKNTVGAVTKVSRRANNGRRGRPPKKDNRSRNKGNGKLWEFIRDLLLNPVTNPTLIRWERREDGIFKFIQSDKVAKMWGERKQNPRMTYEKLSRAMRYYYKSQVLLPVFGRRLVYKFGPNATGWRPQHDFAVGRPVLGYP